LEDAIELDILHLLKIDRADLVRILNPKGYIEPSTRRELECARHLGKEVWFLEPPEGYRNPELVEQAWKE
jgi:hypothetical protein